MKTQRAMPIVTLICLALSIIATLATYNIYYADQRIVDAAHLYRGWPLYWIIESWPTWNPPPYAIIHSFHFQPFNFLIDILFWAVLFQLPSILYLLTKNRIQLKPNSVRNN